MKTGNKIKKLFNIISIGDDVRINSNCESTRKPIYKVYAVIKTKKGIFYSIDSAKGIYGRLFTKEQLKLV